MMQTMIKIKDGMISLPKSVQRSWRSVDNALLVSGQSFFIVKKVEQASGKLSDIAVQIPAPKMKQRELAKEINAYRGGR